jgi:hypothetical protein
MNVGIGNKAAQLHFWECLFQIFATVCLQCTPLNILPGDKDCKYCNKGDCSYSTEHHPWCYVSAMDSPFLPTLN